MFRFPLLFASTAQPAPPVVKLRDGSNGSQSTQSSQQATSVFVTLCALDPKPDVPQ
jgi:hypothetical protein